MRRGSMRHGARERRVRSGDLLAPDLLLAHGVLQRAREALRRQARLAQEIGGARLEGLDRDIRVALLGDQHHRRAFGSLRISASQASPSAPAGRASSSTASQPERASAAAGLPLRRGSDSSTCAAGQRVRSMVATMRRNSLDSSTIRNRMLLGERLAEPAVPLRVSCTACGGNPR